MEFLKDYIEKNGHGPSFREISEAVGLRSVSTVHYHLSELKRLGKIEMDEMKKRTITLPEASHSHQIPILGVVTAGCPILAQENIEGYLPWDGSRSCYALRVQGDSMVGAGILDGDYVIVRPQPTALDGQIVVALLGDEATVKRLRLRDDGIYLMPENPAYSPIDGREASILGLVRGVVRKYG